MTYRRESISKREDLSMSIFNKRSQEEAPPAAPPSNLVEPAKMEATRLSSIPVKTPEPDGTRLQASIRKDAKLVGNIKTARIVIEDGAYFKGSIDIVKPEPAKSSSSSQPKPQATPVAAAIPANSHS